MGIGVLVVCLLIIFTCGMILWATTARTVDPCIITVDSITGRWEIVEPVSSQNKLSINEVAQMSTVNKFVQDWFYISPDMESNDARWMPCTSAECNDSNNVLYGGKECVLYCMSGERLFKNFSDNIVPGYRERATHGQYWFIKPETIRISPAGEISATRGIWRVDATVMSNVGDFQILGYANVEQRAQTDNATDGTYPMNYVQTMGFQVTNFNSYRIN